MEDRRLTEFAACDLDVETGFDCLRAPVADVGANAQPGSLPNLLGHPRYAGAPEDLPSAIVDSSTGAHEAGGGAPARAWPCLRPRRGSSEAAGRFLPVVVMDGAPALVTAGERGRVAVVGVEPSAAGGDR